MTPKDNNGGLVIGEGERDRERRIDRQTGDRQTDRRQRDRYRDRKTDTEIQRQIDKTDILRSDFDTLYCSNVKLQTLQCQTSSYILQSHLVSLFRQ